MLSDITSVITFLVRLPISDGSLLINNLNFKAVTSDWGVSVKMIGK